MATKRCAHCDTIKPLSEFAFADRDTGRRQSWCRSCQAEYKHDWYLKNRDRHMAQVKINQDRASAENQRRMWAYLGTHPCVDCGETDPVVLEFDHISMIIP